MSIKKRIHNNIHSSSIHNRQNYKQFRCLSTEWINKVWHILNGILHSNKKELLLIYTTIWINLKSRVEKNRKQEDHMTPFI